MQALGRPPLRVVGLAGVPGTHALAALEQEGAEVRSLEAADSAAADALLRRALQELHGEAAEEELQAEGTWRGPRLRAWHHPMFTPQLPPLAASPASPSTCSTSSTRTSCACRSAWPPPSPWRA